MSGIPTASRRAFLQAGAGACATALGQPPLRPYDLSNDPDELRNLAADSHYDAVADDLRARLYKLMERFDDPYSGRGPSGRFMAPRYLPRGRRLPQ